jgi:hypothetical protein
MLPKQIEIKQNKRKNSFAHVEQQSFFVRILQWSGHIHILSLRTVEDDFVKLSPSWKQRLWYSAMWWSWLWATLDNPCVTKIRILACIVEHPNKAPTTTFNSELDLGEIYLDFQTLWKHGAELNGWIFVGFAPILRFEASTHGFRQNGWTNFPTATTTQSIGDCQESGSIIRIYSNWLRDNYY